MKDDKTTIIFTDGASLGNPGPGGFGALVIRAGEVFEIGGSEKHTTNNRMELTAFIKAFEGLKDVKEDELFVVYTDSSYLINGITKWIYSWEKRNWITQNKEPVLNKDLWEEILELTKNKNIDWQHVPGHAGVPGNEKVDSIASSFAKGERPKLFVGLVDGYKIKVSDLVLKDETKIKNRNTSKSRSKAKAYSYLSKVEGVIKKHKTWAECEKRVKGVSGARFKKALSPEEEKEIIKEWQK